MIIIYIFFYIYSAQTQNIFIFFFIPKHTSDMAKKEKKKKNSELVLDTNLLCLDWRAFLRVGGGIPELAH